jgi:hypothetical protein
MVPADTFYVKEEHLKLLRRLNIKWMEIGSAYGVPQIDAKRPYGNSDVMRDLCGILGYETDGDGWNDPTEYAQAELFHREMATVLQICLQTRRFEAGRYWVKDGRWKKCYEETDPPPAELSRRDMKLFGRFLLKRHAESFVLDWQMDELIRFYIENNKHTLIHLDEEANALPGINK